MPLVVMAALAVGLVAQVNYLLGVTQDGGARVATLIVVCSSVAFALLLGGLLALMGRRQLLDLSRSYEDTLALSEQQAEALGESERQFRAMFDSAQDALTMVDDQGAFIDLNPAAAALFGRPREALLGNTYAGMVDPPYDDEAFARFRTQNVPTRGELRILRPDGTSRMAEFNATPNFLPGRHLSLIRDVTERRRHEEEIRRLNDSLERRVRERTAQLEEANRELESFSYSVSHDLRSPLRHISGFSELLRKSAISGSREQTGHYVTTIADAARRASTLVDELLAFSKMGRAELRNAEVDMRALVEGVREELQLEAQGRKVRWTLGELPRVRGDGAMLRLAVRNLLSNALKYTRPREEARIDVGCELQSGAWVFCVRDNGVGFDMACADNLFGVFKRLHRDDEFEGTGIGLANVKRIVTRHGGRAWADGRPGDGATFFFSLPQSPVTPSRSSNKGEAS